ncbi:MAG: ABC transporter permease [Candidatus Aenigmarchaeota archaeon]|nr:ABC transporter permease [Candidatus Aenigmarchaeota archaeon]
MNKNIEYVRVIFQKNIRLLLRARASALVVLLGPLLLIFLAGLAFDNTNTYAVKVGTYSHAYNDLSNSFIDRLADSKFLVTRFDNSDDCTGGIKKGTVHTCLVFSPDFELNNNKSNEITFFVDYSKLNLVWTVLNAMTSKISTRNQELSRNLTARVLSALELSKKTISGRRASMTKLVNSNDAASKLVADIKVRVNELDLAFNATEVGLTDLSNNKDRVKHWVENSLNIAETSLSKSQNFIDIAGTVVKGSSASNDIKDSVSQYLSDMVQDLAQLEDRFSTTKQVMQEEFISYDDMLNSIIGHMTQLKAKLDAAITVRDSSMNDFERVKQLLDAALVELLTTQKALSDLEKVLNSVEVTDADAIVSPITTTIKPLVAEKSYLNYLFPTLIVLIVMFTALLLGPILIILEKNSPAHVRNSMVPVPEFVPPVANFVTCFVILGIQLLVILGIASFFFTTSLISNFFTVFLVCVWLLFCFSLIGMILGYSFNNETTANLAGVSLSTVLLLFSNAIIPVESMPSWLSKIVVYNPFVVGVEMLRKAVVFQLSAIAIWKEIFILLFFCLLFVGILFLLHGSIKKHLYTKQ